MNPFSDLITEDRDPSVEKEKVVIKKRKDTSFDIFVWLITVDNTKKKSCQATILVQNYFNWFSKYWQTI